MDAIKHLKESEGLRLKAYKDSVGVWSIGYGRNLQELSISQATAEQWLQEDYAVATVNASLVLANQGVSAQEIGQARFEVLVEMCYNLGPSRFQGFQKMFSALREQEYLEASYEMLNSLWASQVHGRAVRLALVMETGDWASLDSLGY